MKSVCVFCGSSPGRNSEYKEAGFLLGKMFAENKVQLVYGGASIGVMGAIAEGALGSNGKVIGVIPQSIKDIEVGHMGLTELHVVDTMHTRKQKMYDLSDAFVILPGGMGTLDELCEIVTWAQLKYHNKPVYIVNLLGFFDGLLQHFSNMNNEGFYSDEHLKLFKVVSDIPALLEEILT